MTKLNLLRTFFLIIVDCLLSSFLQPSVLLEHFTTRPENNVRLVTLASIRAWRELLNVTNVHHVCLRRKCTPKAYRIVNVSLPYFYKKNRTIRNYIKNLFGIKISI